MLTIDRHAPAPTQVSPPDGFDLAAACEQLLPALLARRGDLLAIKDAVSGRYLHVNHDMAAFLQRPPSAIVGLTDAELFESHLATAFRAAEATAQASPEPLQSDHRFEWAGQRHEFAVLRVLAQLPKQQVLCSVWHNRGAERLQQAQLKSALEQLEHEQRANETLRRELQDHGGREAATGYFTQAQFEDQLRREVDLSTREHREFSLVLIEIDPWIDTVRQMGEPAQAKIFESLGRLIRGNTRAMDASCRLEDKRFAVLLSGVGLATAHSRMEQLRRQCSTQIVMCDAQQLRFTASIGVASFPHTAATQEELMLACEAAAQQARSRGNQVQLARISFDLG